MQLLSYCNPLVTRLLDLVMDELPPRVRGPRQREELDVPLGVHQLPARLLVRREP